MCVCKRFVGFVCVDKPVSCVSGSCVLKLAFETSKAYILCEYRYTAVARCQLVRRRVRLVLSLGRPFDIFTVVLPLYHDDVLPPS